VHGGLIECAERSKAKDMTDMIRRLVRKHFDNDPSHRCFDGKLKVPEFLDRLGREWRSNRRRGRGNFSDGDTFYLDPFGRHAFVISWCRGDFFHDIHSIGNVGKRRELPVHLKLIAHADEEL
jgi:hypothetical protein